MNIGFSDIYNETLDHICMCIHDISLSIDPKSKSASRYRLIPTTKKNKNYLLINALDLITSESYSIFLSNQTIGIKVYDIDLNKQYEYAVSKNKETKIIQLNYQNGTGIKQTYHVNPKDNEFEIVNITVDEYLKNVIDISGYEDDIINEDLMMHLQYDKKVDETTLHIKISFGKGLNTLGKKAYYSFDKHPELYELSADMRQNKEELIENYLSCLIAVEPDLFLKETGLFYSNFKEMLHELSDRSKKPGQSEPHEYSDR